MAVVTRTVVVVDATCDSCGKSIDTIARYVDATVYGAAFHTACWDGLGGPKVARVLGLDDIYYYRADERLGRAWAQRRG